MSFVPESFMSFSISPDYVTVTYDVTSHLLSKSKIKKSKSETKNKIKAKENKMKLSLSFSILQSSIHRVLTRDNITVEDKLLLYSSLITSILIYNNTS